MENITVNIEDIKTYLSNEEKEYFIFLLKKILNRKEEFEGNKQ